MKEFFKSFFARSLAVIALVLVGVMIYSATTGGVATIPAKLTGIFITPVQTLVTNMSDGVSDFFGGITGTKDIKDRLE